MFAAAPTTPAPRITLDALALEAQHALQGILTLDPETAALRAGLSLLVLALACAATALQTLSGNASSSRPTRYSRDLMVHNALQGPIAKYGSQSATITA